MTSIAETQSEQYLPWGQKESIGFDILNITTLKILRRELASRKFPYLKSCL